LKYEVPLLWPSYIGERRTTVAKSLWDKSEVLCRTCLVTHWELGEHIWNLMGTHWELKREHIRDERKMEKKT